jgi:hypothetical protein
MNPLKQCSWTDFPQQVIRVINSIWQGRTSKHMQHKSVSAVVDINKTRKGMSIGLSVLKKCDKKPLKVYLCRDLSVLPGLVYLVLPILSVL